MTFGNGTVFRAGNSFPSIVVGGSGDDTLVGGSGVELLVAGAGNDLLRSNNGSDTLYGGDGDDTLIGGAGGDILDGGAGRNLLSYTNTQYSTGAYGTFDTNSGWAAGTNMVIVGGSDTSNLTLKGIARNSGGGLTATGNLISTASILTQGVTYNFSVDITNNTSGTLVFSFGGTTINAAVGFGTYTGSFTAGATTFTLSTTGAFSGVIDNVFFLAQNAGVNINLQTGVVSGNDAANDTISNFQDVLGSLANDTIVGDGNDNSLDGWLGNDSLNGGGGNDILFGDVGDDSFNGGAGNDSINGGSGSDLAVYSGHMSEYDMWVDANGKFNIRDKIANRDGADTLDSIELLYFAGFPNFGNRPLRFGDGYVNGAGFSFTGFVLGRDQNDTVVGGNGDDYLIGAGGNDVFIGHFGNDTILGGDGDDTVMGGAGSDSLDGGTGINTLSFANTQYASNTFGTFDFPFGWSWNQATATISQGVFSTFQPTTGSVVSLSSVLTNGVIYNYTFDLENTTGSALTFSLNGQSITINPGFATYTGSFTAASTTLSLTILNGGSFTGSLDNFFVRDVTAGVNVNLQSGVATGGDAQGDVIVAGTFRNLIGSIANDTLTGDGNDNRIDGWLGNDTLNGGGGADNLIGGAGNDTLVGGTNNDILDGGTGTDVAVLVGQIMEYDLSRDANNNIIVRDLVANRDGTDTLSGIENLIFSGTTAAASPIITGNGNLTNPGYGVTNLVWVAGSGNDTITGNAFSNDYAWSGDGNDSINGGGVGTDVFNAGAGNDTMILDVSQLANGSRADGGAGVDVFQFAVKATATSASATLADLNKLLDNTETLDFTGANNRINLTGSGTSGAIDLSAGSTDRTAFAEIGGGAAVTIRYNASGANDQDSFGAITGAAAMDETGTVGTSGYTQNYYADAAKTQLLLTLIAA